jgi:gamma-glutamyltranspeptidase/glutathione hydrolase
MALEKYGTKSLQEVMAPAIELAENGFVISPTLSQIIADDFGAIHKEPQLAKILAPEGLPLEAGEILKNPDLAKSLRKIAAGGRDVFYKGELADAIASAMAAKGGLVGKADLAAPINKAIAVSGKGKETVFTVGLEDGTVWQVKQ